MVVLQIYVRDANKLANSFDMDLTNRVLLYNQYMRAATKCFDK